MPLYTGELGTSDSMPGYLTLGKTGAIAVYVPPPAVTASGSTELALALQSSRGTAAAASTQRSALMGGRLTPTFGLSTNPELRASRSPGPPWIPAVGGSGDVMVIVRPKIIGLLLYAALGAKSVSGAGDPYTHVFTPAGVLPWLTAWGHFAGAFDERFRDVRIGRLVISSSAGGVVTAVVSLLAGSAAFRTAQETAAAMETADPMLHYHGASALLVEGVAFSTIRQWTLTIDPAVQLQQSLAGPVPRMNGMMSLTMDITHTLPDATLWNRAIYGSASPSNLDPPAIVPMTLSGSPVGVQFTLTEQSSPERSLKIAIPQVALGRSEMSPNVNYGPLIATTQLLGYAPAAGAAITATLRNGQASY